jgi:hypothetical protein
MKTLLRISVLLAFSGALFGQKHDYIWTMGYDSNPFDTSFSGFNIDFNYKPPKITKKYRDMDFYTLSACISNADGQLQFYSNGCYIANRNEQMMENGDHLNPGPMYDSWCFDGSDYPAGMQSMLILPSPDTPWIYFIFHKILEINWDAISPELLCSKVDMSFNNGLGKVMSKNIPVMQDSLAPSELTAVRHANGKDWWIITPQYENLGYYVFLFTKDGISDTLEQTIGKPYFLSTWQCIFSPDGAKFVRYGIYDDISIFDFDRATGQLSNFKFIPLQEETYQGNPPVNPGCAISPNSRFLYIAAQYAIYQFDLWADDIEASKQLIAVYDDFYSPYATIFNTMQLGPDCKIYISIPNGVDVLHVINRPDEPGLACDLVQHGVSLPVCNAAMPLFPNYRLGATPSYPCDSTLSVRVGAPVPSNGVMVMPNPASDRLRARLPGPALRPATFVLAGIGGIVMRRADIPAGAEEAEMSVADLPPGLYVWTLESGGAVAARGKVMVVR